MKTPTDDTVTPIRPGIESIPNDAPAPTGRVIPLGALTKLDVPVENVLNNAKHLEGVVIMGWDKNGEAHFASTYADGGTVLWLLEKLKQRLLD